MNVIIVNCFDTYEDRVELIYDFFSKRDDNVKVITSNFRHFHKVFRDDVRENYIFLETKPYYKNLSVTRMYSHWCFAKRVIQELPKYNPDLVYVLVPPNSLVKEAANYKSNNMHVKLIFDLIDLWPEAMPTQHFKNFFLLKKWADLRNNYLALADYVVTECDLYQHQLQKFLSETMTKTVCLAHGKKQADIQDKTTNEKIALCYLGSINNIIDIEVIGEIISQIAANTRVDLHIIGDGEKKGELLRTAQKKGATVYDHGRVYDPLEKQRIFNVCDYGLNIMKTSVCVGLTMKSIDYLEGGLPLINNIKGDTWEFVEQYHIGTNFEKGQQIKLIHVDKVHVRAFYEQRFTGKVFEENMQAVYDAVTR